MLAPDLSERSWNLTRPSLHNDFKCVQVFSIQLLTHNKLQMYKTKKRLVNMNANVNVNMIHQILNAVVDTKKIRVNP